MNALTITQKIRNFALSIGFDACGFAKAKELTAEASRLEHWLKENRQGTMDWMGKNFDKRINPSVLVPGAKTVISLLSSYHHPLHKKQIGTINKPQVAKYAQGRDYHKVLKKKLNELFNYTTEIVGKVEGRVFVDSAPILDKAWAVQAGLGWVGKNSNILNKNLGSWFFIAEMIIDIELKFDTPTTDHCGSCTRCIEACPTDAIYEPYKVDASKCISYLTIEHKGDIEERYHTNMQNWVFGCDICQDVCPWNSKAKLAQFLDFYPRNKVLEAADNHFKSMDEKSFNDLFAGSPVRRTKWEGFKRNLSIVNTNIE